MKDFVIGLIIGAILTTGGLYLGFKDQLFVGANPSPSSTNSFSCVNDVCQYFYSQRAITASSTLCSLKTPAATTTLVSATFQVYTGTSTAGSLALSKGTSLATSSTLIGSTFAVGANLQATIQASTSPAAGDVLVIAPNSYLVWGAHAPSAQALYTYGAVCQTVLRGVRP